MGLTLVAGINNVSTFTVIKDHQISVSHQTHSNSLSSVNVKLCSKTHSGFSCLLICYHPHTAGSIINLCQLCIFCLGNLSTLGIFESTHSGKYVDGNCILYKQIRLGTVRSTNSAGYKYPIGTHIKNSSYFSPLNCYTETVV